MKKQTILTSTIVALALSGSALAANANSNDSYFNGLYIGAKIGMNFNKLNQKTIKQHAFWNEAENDYQKGITYGENLGYGYVFHKFYIGAELGYYKQSNLKDTTFRTIWMHYKLHNKLSSDMTADALIGYTITPKLLVYGRIGAGFQSMKTTYTGVRNNYTKYVMNGEKKNFNSLRVGVGAKYALSQHFSMTVDYVHEQAKKIEYPRVNIGLGYQDTMKPSSNTVLVGIQYTF